MNNYPKIKLLDTELILNKDFPSHNVHYQQANLI